MCYIIKAASIDHDGNIRVTARDTNEPEEGYARFGFMGWDGHSVNRQVRLLGRALFDGEMVILPSCKSRLGRAFRTAAVAVGTADKHPFEVRYAERDRFVNVFERAALGNFPLVA